MGQPRRPSAAWRDVIYKGNDNYYLRATSTNGGQPAGGGTFAGGGNAKLTATSALPPNTWSYLALTYDGATLRLYVNGALVASQAKTGTIAESTNPLQIGGDSLYGQYFSGLIDEVRVYNVALTAGADPDRHDHAGRRRRAADTQAPSAPGTLTATAASMQRDRPHLGRGDRQRRRHRLPDLPLRRVRAARTSRCSRTTAGTTFNDTGLSASTSYGYEVRALDAAGNLGAFSNAAAADHAGTRTRPRRRARCPRPPRARRRSTSAGAPRPTTSA